MTSRLHLQHITTVEHLFSNSLSPNTSCCNTLLPGLQSVENCIRINKMWCELFDYKSFMSKGAFPSAITCFQSRNAIKYVSLYLPMHSVNNNGCIKKPHGILKPKEFLGPFLLQGSSGSTVRMKMCKRWKHFLPNQDTVGRFPHYTTVNVIELPFLISSMFVSSTFQCFAMKESSKSTFPCNIASEQINFCFQNHTWFLITWKSLPTLQSYPSTSWQRWWF